MTHADAPHPLLAGDEARYAGQPVALVVAASRALAEDAAELVDVEYEPLDAVVDPHAATEELMRFERTSGDVDGAFAAAAHVVVARHAIPRVVAVPMEPRGIVAEPAGDGLTVWASAQDTHRTLAGLAHALRRERGTIRVIMPDVGGAFGSKGPPAPRRPRWRSRRSGSAARSSGPRTGSRTSSPPTRAAAWTRRWSSRSTPTGGCSPCARGSSPTSAPTCT